MTRLDDDERNTIILNEGIGNPEKAIINESGLYSLVLSSRKPEAKAFKKWITKEVLPSIRMTGEYKSKYNKLREKSKRTRCFFTETLKNHGCSKPGHYIQITKSMKVKVGIDENKKKDQFDFMELSKIAAAEMVSTVNIEQEGANTYRECMEISDNASMAIKYATRSRLAS